MVTGNVRRPRAENLQVLNLRIPPFNGFPASLISNIILTIGFLAWHGGNDGACQRQRRPA